MRSIVLALVLLGSTSASAQVSGHSNPVVKLVRGGQAFKLNLRLTDHNGFGNARVGLIPRDKATTALTRLQASDPKQGVLLHQFPAVTGFKQGETREVEWEVPFSATIPRGAKLSIVSAWSRTLTETNPHVFGGVTQAAEAASSHIDLP